MTGIIAGVTHYALLDNPYGYCGYYFDQGTAAAKVLGPGGGGLYQCRFRVYDPVAGRWLQQDPAGFVDGSNLYEYCGSDSVNCFDPAGLTVRDIDWEYRKDDTVSGNPHPGLIQSSHSGGGIPQDAVTEGMIALSLVPGVGEAMDLAIMLSPDPTTPDWVRVAASISFALNVVTDGFLPNFGAFRLGRAADESLARSARLAEQEAESAVQTIRIVERTTEQAQREAGSGVRSGAYGKLKGTLSKGEQANHLNQDAAYRGIIPRKEGVANAMRGNAFSESTSPHYRFHESLEAFWEQYRTGPFRGKVPTNAEYGLAVERALRDGGLSARDAADLATQAARQRAAYGLCEGAPVPKIPGRMNQKKSQKTEVCVHPRTNATIKQLDDVTWFANVGIKNANEAIVVASWDEAIRHCSSDTWQDLCLEAANQLRERILERSRERYLKWNDVVDSVKPSSESLVRRKLRGAATANPLPQVVEQCVQWDILHLLMESEYADVFPPAFFASQAYWYLHGHFPCGWKGAFPRGMLIVY